ncbi:DEAD/DEAH box helicase [Oceanobacillus profundus]|uniref:Helicase SNF2 n=1 Tax=Oceanobacillus profundus TaxID=372463 RepID=A0A417YP11_9BACI|nr:DEAD/DEAH box helicase [Oceanobacillus profundus]MBR3120346.1 SNF2 helicase associated domain-containing protein [Oceanobacillus sp.]PAE30655.1 helicase SNF2 [Paenibacillus sp. 7884-2]RHW35360.1 helicase SNF2 [Oceanobacillus profundus]
MKKISDINIQKLFPSTIYKRGKDYYKQNKVSDLLYDINYQVWTATVHGSEDYFVEINMKDYTNGSIDTYCDCPAFETFGTCKHIAATLMQIANKEQAIPNAPSKPNYQLTNKFIQALRTLPQQNAQPEILPNKLPMHVEYHCSWGFDQQLQIELRTGEKHCYVVKDAYQFLVNILQGNEYYFTKKFIFHPDTHYFLQKDLELFEMLFAIKRNEEMYQGYSRFHYEGNSGDKRYIAIPPLTAKELLEKLSERDFTVETQQKSFQHIGVEKDTLPFRFSLTKSNQNDLLMKMSDATDAMYFPYYEMIFHEGVFYYPTKDQVQVLEEVTKFGMDELQLPIPKEQADVFLSEVLPSLKKIGGVEVSESITEEIIQVPLRAKLYLEVKGDWIIGKLEYHYGDQLIDPFNGRKDNDRLIIREVEKEQQIMQLIEQANFHYNGKELYIEADEEELYDFLYYILPRLDKEVELFFTSEIRGMIIENELSPSTSVRLEGTSNLLEIGFDINGVNDSEINQILNAVIEKKRYYRLGSGELLSLEGEEFTSIKRLFDEMQIHKNDLLNGHVQMPVYRGTQLDELIDTKKNYDPSFRHLLHQLKSPEEQVYELPEQLQASLRNYQMTGFRWFKSLSNYHLGGILADDMGLGKTLQSIAYIASEKEQKGAEPNLIIAPSSVVYNWKNEFEKFAPHLSVVVLTGSPEERQQLIEASIGTDVWITSYATLRQDIEIYREFSFQSMILDEAQYIKNYATKTSQAIREIKAARRFALSGTPIENSIDELWAIFQVVLPGLMPNQRSFKQLSNEKIAMITRPFILRRLKKDVLKELPDKIESVHVSELTKEQKDLYVGYLRQVQQEAAQSMKESAFQQNRMKILAGLTRLRQLCCHPSLFIENYEGYSGKLEQLMDTVKTAIESGKRMLIFSQFTSMHEIIKERLEKEGFGYFYLHGQTPAKDRVEMSERFNNGENSIFLISLKAGGTGLNLTGADTVILYDLWWNPAVEDQATGRAHRFGQKNVVQVIRLVTEGTIEEKIYDLQQKKRELIDQVIQPGETMLSSLSEDDIRQLLSL